MHIENKELFTENQARFYIAELILAIEYLHSLNIIYRDLKPENILIGNDGHLKLTDFGLAKQMPNQYGNRSLSFCGSLLYLSPEMVMKKNPGKEIDIYGIGAILYELLSGFPPFYNQDPTTMLNNIQFGHLKIPKYISGNAQSILEVSFIFILGSFGKGS